MVARNRQDGPTYVSTHFGRRRPVLQHFHARSERQQPVFGQHALRTVGHKISALQTSSRSALRQRYGLSPLDGWLFLEPPSRNSDAETRGQAAQKEDPPILRPTRNIGGDHGAIAKPKLRRCKPSTSSIDASERPTYRISRQSAAEYSNSSARSQPGRSQR